MLRTGVTLLPEGLRLSWTVLSRGVAAAHVDPALAQEYKEIERFAATFHVNQIPRERLVIQFARSRGPGGQNVNKVNTKADVRFKLSSADWLPPYVRTRLATLEANRINKSGEMVITSERNRLQHQNLEDCISKLYEMILRAAEVPKEPTAEQRAHVERLEKQAAARRRQEKEARSRAKRDRMDD